MNNSGTILEAYDYYPFDLQMPGRVVSGVTKEGFTGQERDTETNLDYFGARYYMSALGRWTSVDPLAEKHPEWSPYNYVLGNPLRLVDPDGRQVDVVGASSQSGCAAGPCVHSYAGGREMAFAFKYPSLAVAIGPGFVDNGYNIATVSTRFAVRTGLPQDASFEGDYPNAVRHVLWEAAATALAGPKAAREMGDAHEPNPDILSDFPNGATNGFDLRGDADNYVDQLNNVIGRDIGSRMAGGSMKQMAIATLNVFRHEGLWTITQNASGRFVPTLTRLTSEQYGIALTNILGLDWAGFRGEEVESRVRNHVQNNVINQ